MDHLKTKTAIGVASLAFFAVIREGFETSVFIWSAVRATGSDTAPVIGAVFGLVLAAIMGYLIFLGSLKINLSKFFGYTGAFLIVVAAGIFGYGVHEFQEIGLLPVLTETAWDMTGIIAPNGFVDTILRGTISFRAAPSWLEAIVWFGYLIPTSYIFWKQSTKKS